MITENHLLLSTDTSEGTTKRKDHKSGVKQTSKPDIVHNQWIAELMYDGASIRKRGYR